MVRASAVLKWRLHLPRKYLAHGIPPAAYAASDLDAAPAPDPHLLSEGDFFPIHTEVAVLMKNKS